MKRIKTNAMCILCLIILATASLPVSALEQILLGAAGQAVEGIMQELQIEEGDIMPYVTALEFIVETAEQGLGNDNAGVRDEAALVLSGVFVRLSEALIANEELWRIGGTRQAEVAGALVFLGETAVPGAGIAIADPAPTVRIAGITAAGEVLSLLHYVGASGESAEVLVQSMRELLEHAEVDSASSVSQTAQERLQQTGPAEPLAIEALMAQKQSYEAKLHDFLNQPMEGFYPQDITEFEHYAANEELRHFVDHLFALGYGIEQAEGYYYLYVDEPVNYRDGEVD